MNIYTKAVHAGDRRKPGAIIPVTNPIYTASSFICENLEQLDRVFAGDEEGYCYARYDNPTNSALEELSAALENGHGALACGSGMAALHLALTVAIAERRKSILAADALYGATIKLLLNVMDPAGIEVRFADVFDREAFAAAMEREKPGCVLLETISNPMLRVADLEWVAGLCRTYNAALVVDNTFATPVLLRPLEWGADFTVHSATKYLAGHGDVLGGIIVTNERYYEPLRTLSRVVGPVLGPFESYLTMRGIKTLGVRVERQCANACRVAAWLASHAAVERVFFPGDPAHPDAATIKRLFPAGLYGAMVAFELRGAGRAEVFRFMNALRLVVRATSLGDVHSMMLYPFMSSHRDVAPRQRERMGIRENLVRLSVGIEAVEDVLDDLDQAFKAL